MKKLIPILTVALLAACTLSFAAPDPEANRQIKSLKSRATALEASVTAAQTDIDATEVVANAAVPKASLAQRDTNTVADATLHTPAFVGQLLIGTVSNVVWTSGGTTTNSWIQLSN